MKYEILYNEYIMVNVISTKEKEFLKTIKKLHPYIFLCKLDRDISDFTNDNIKYLLFYSHDSRVPLNPNLTLEDRLKRVSNDLYIRSVLDFRIKPLNDKVPLREILNTIDDLFLKKYGYTVVGTSKFRITVVEGPQLPENYNVNQIIQKLINPSLELIDNKQFKMRLKQIFIRYEYVELKIANDPI